MWSDEVASVSISVQHGHAALERGRQRRRHDVRLLPVAPRTVPCRHGTVPGLGPAHLGCRLRRHGPVPLRPCCGAAGAPQVAVVATAIVVTNRMVITKAQEARRLHARAVPRCRGGVAPHRAVERVSTARLVAWAVVSALACYSLLLSPLFAVAQFVSSGHAAAPEPPRAGGGCSQRSWRRWRSCRSL